MYLSNDMYQDGVCNGTVGIVTHVDADSKIVRVAFISISHKAIIDAHITLNQHTSRLTEIKPQEHNFHYKFALH